MYATESSMTIGYGHRQQKDSCGVAAVVDGKERHVENFIFLCFFFGILKNFWIEFYVIYINLFFFYIII